MNSAAEQLCWFDQDGLFGKMSLAPSVPENPNTRISGLSLKRSSALSAIPFMSLDLTPGHGNLLGESYWEMISPWRGGSSTRNTGACPKDAVASSLWQILQAEPPRKYYLSKSACLGILRRAQARGKELPPKLQRALKIQAGLEKADEQPIQPIAFAANQRDEVRDLHDVSGALCAQQSVKQQTFVAACFSAGAGASAGGIGYSERIAPTLKGSAGGNAMPSVMCLNDQGGRIMACSENISGTLRAQEHGHHPLVYENHALCPAEPVVSAECEAGGPNEPLTEQEAVFCITGNAIDRQPQNGGNGIGYQTDIAYTLTATDHHAVFSRQRVDIFRENDVVCTESARQHKDATDLVYQQQAVGALTPSDAKGPNNQYVVQEKLVVDNTLLIRRLTPLECERLQGFPDGWTDLPGASDSVRYKALGNSVAIPCVVYVMQGIRWAAAS